FSAETPRAAPRTLPAPAHSGYVCEDDARPAHIGGRAARTPDAVDDTPDDLRPVSAALRGFVQLAGIQDARVQPDQRGRIADRTRAIATVGQAWAYLVEVADRLRAIGLGGGTGPAAPA